MKLSPQLHLFVATAVLASLAMPAVSRAERERYICERINVPNNAKVDEKARAQNRDRLAESWRNTLGRTLSVNHREGVKTTSAGTSTAKGVTAQNLFLVKLITKVKDGCELQLAAEQGVQGLTAKVNEAKTNAPGQMCDRFKEVEGIYQQSQGAMKQVNAFHKEAAENLRKEFFTQAGENLANINAIATNDPRVDLTKLKTEVAHIWGSNVSEKNLQDPKFQLDRNAFFSGLLYRMEGELKNSEKFTKMMDSERQRMAQLAYTCAGAGAVTTTPPATATPTPPESDISGTEPAPADVAAADPAAPAPPDAAADPTNPATPENSPVEQPEIEAAVVDTGDGGDPDATGKGGLILPPTTPPPAAEQEGWISRNKGTLLVVGGGAAVVGGILLYKKHQDKKADAKKQAAEDEAYSAALTAKKAAESASSTATSTSTSTSTDSSTSTADSTVGGTPVSTSTPQGSKLVLNGVPASAKAGEILPEITIAVIDPKGILTQDSSTDISVSCEGNCSLMGTLTVNTDGGKSVFKDLRFASAESGIKLKFSAPGFTTVVSSQTIDVTQ